MQPENTDPQHAPAHCHIEPLGCFQQTANSQIRVFLDDDFDTCKQEAELERLGFVIRRADSRDMSTIERLFSRRISEALLDKVGLAMLHKPPNVHLALVGGEIVAFAAHSTMHEECGDLGPIGGIDEAGGLGLGQVLLYRCMTDLQAAGHQTAFIPLDGSDTFRKHLLNCRFDRVTR